MLKPKEKELYLARDREIREEIALYIATHIDKLVDLEQTGGISSLNLAERWRNQYDHIVVENHQRCSKGGHSGQLIEILNAHSAGLIDKFAEMFEDSYRHEPYLSFIREKGKLPKDSEYYPDGLYMKVRAA